MLFDLKGKKKEEKIRKKKIKIVPFCEDVLRGCRRPYQSLQVWPPPMRPRRMFSTVGSERIDSPDEYDSRDAEESSPFSDRRKFLCPSGAEMVKFDGSGILVGLNGELNKILEPFDVYPILASAYVFFFYIYKKKKVMGPTIISLIFFSSFSKQFLGPELHIFSKLKKKKISSGANPATAVCFGVCTHCHTPFRVSIFF